MEGNYNECRGMKRNKIIIPLREMEGNYNRLDDEDLAAVIIPLREMEGNYNVPAYRLAVR